MVAAFWPLPPEANRGVGSTETFEKVQNAFLVDTLSFTSKSDSISDVIDLLRLSVSWQHTYGAKGYKQRMYFSGISIHYDSDNPDQHIWVEMSGEGCRTYETFGANDFVGLISWIMASDQRHLTRLDIAYDDFEGVIDLPVIYTALGDRNYISRCRSWTREDNSDGGMTLYLGSKHSDCFFRIYNKAVERGYDPAELHWVRLELQLRDDYAVVFVSQGFDFGQTMFSVLSGLWRFVDPDEDDSNKSRWQTSAWWSRLLDGVQSCNLFIAPGVDYNATKLEHFVIDQAGQAVSCFVELNGWEALYDRLRVSYQKMLRNERYQNVLEKYKT